MFLGIPEALRLNNIKYKGDFTENMYATLLQINREKEENAVILISGSLFILRHAKDCLGVPQHIDGEGLDFI